MTTTNGNGQGVGSENYWEQPDDQYNGESLVLNPHNKRIDLQLVYSNLHTTIILLFNPKTFYTDLSKLLYPVSKFLLYAKCN